MACLAAERIKQPDILLMIALFCDKPTMCILARVDRCTHQLVIPLIYKRIDFRYEHVGLPPVYSLEIPLVVSSFGIRYTEVINIMGIRSSLRIDSGLGNVMQRLHTVILNYPEGFIDPWPSWDIYTGYFVRFCQHCVSPAVPSTPEDIADPFVISSVRNLVFRNVGELYQINPDKFLREASYAPSVLRMIFTVKAQAAHCSVIDMGRSKRDKIGIDVTVTIQGDIDSQPLSMQWDIGTACAISSTVRSVTVAVHPAQLEGWGHARAAEFSSWRKQSRYKWCEERIKLVDVRMLADEPWAGLFDGMEPEDWL